MFKKFVFAFAFSILGASASATVVNYDFKLEANKTGQIGEAIFSTFNTSTNGVFVGPKLQVTATNNGDAAYVYFDNGNAGMGVCNSPKYPSAVNRYNPGSGSNVCTNAGDDGLTTTGETLHFMATDTSVHFSAIFINSNHDNAPIMDTVWDINGTVFDKNDPAWSVASLSQSGDIRIALDIMLHVGDTLSIHGVSGPDSYISGVSVSPAPLPAGVLLLLTGLAGLGVARRRRG